MRVISTTPLPIMALGLRWSREIGPHHQMLCYGDRSPHWDKGLFFSISVTNIPMRHHLDLQGKNSSTVTCWRVRPFPEEEQPARDLAWRRFANSPTVNSPTNSASHQRQAAGCWCGAVQHLIKRTERSDDYARAVAVDSCQRVHSPMK